MLEGHSSLHEHPRRLEADRKLLRGSACPELVTPFLL